MRAIPMIGSHVWAHIVRPGMVVKTGTGERIEVQKIDEGYDTITFDNLCGRKATVNYADQVEVLGYYNP